MTQMASASPDVSVVITFSLAIGLFFALLLLKTAAQLVAKAWGLLK